jgi:hypothetical protein
VQVIALAGGQLQQPQWQETLCRCCRLLLLQQMSSSRVYCPAMLVPPCQLRVLLHAQAGVAAAMCNSARSFHCN